MLYKLNLEHILFLDIETVPQHQNFSNLDETAQILWEQKTQYQRKDGYTPDEFYERAGIWAEFGKIVCISVGYFKTQGDVRTFRVTSFYGDEPDILKQFKQLLQDHFSWLKSPVSHFPILTEHKEIGIARQILPLMANLTLPRKLRR